MRFQMQEKSINFSKIKATKWETIVLKIINYKLVEILHILRITLFQLKKTILLTFLMPQNISERVQYKEQGKISKMIKIEFQLLLKVGA